MATGPYNLPQGIDVNDRQTQAVPRKVGAYDKEGILTSAVVPNQLVYFQNAAQFAVTTVVYGNQKLYGRDTNITSRTGGMAKGERLYAYGLTAKIDAENQSIANATAATAITNIGIFDQWRRIWGYADIAINLGSDEFIRVQARDVPLFTCKNVNSTNTTNNSFTVTNEVWSDGMYDLTVAGDPYTFDQQEDFRINVNFTIGLTAAPTLVLETYLTMRLEGVRLKALRQ